MPPGPTSSPLGLGARLAFAFSALCIVLTVVLLAVLERTATARVKDEIGGRLKDAAAQVTGRLDRSMFERYREVQLMAQRLAAVPSGEARVQLEGAQASYPYYAWIGMADATGRVQAATGGLLEGESVAKRPWFTSGLKGPFVGDVHEAVLLARLLGQGDAEPLRFFDYAFPLVRDGRVQGVLGAHLSWAWAKEVRPVVSSLPGETPLPETLILRADGTVLLGPADLQDRKLQVDSIVFAGRDTPGYHVERWPDGKQYLVGYSRSQGHRESPGLGWIVLVRDELDDAYASVRDLQRNLALTGLLVALVFGLVAWAMARSITKPVLELASAAARLESGEATRVPVPPSYPEVRALGQALNALVSKLQGLNAGLEKRVQERTAELSAALSRVRASEQRIQTIIEGSHDAFIGMDLEGRIIDWNSQAEALFGWAREEVLGRKVSDTIVPARYVSAFEHAITHVLATSSREGLERPMERTLVARDGREIAVEARLSLVETGEHRFFSAFVHDITARREVARLKDEFISTVSHELRTPLTSIHGAVKLLEQGAAGPLPDAAAKLVTLAAENSQRLRVIVDDILDLEKIASGRMEFHLETLSAPQVLARAAAGCQVAAQAAGVELRVEATPLGLRGDPLRLQQVLVNLLSNAIKFAPRDTAVLLQSLPSPRAGFARLQVIDHGPGVPPEFRPRIFERFAQADMRSNRTRGGSGLGLSIAREMVEGMGGHIGFESEPGRTCFHVDMPQEDT